MSQGVPDSGLARFRAGCLKLELREQSLMLYVKGPNFEMEFLDGYLIAKSSRFQIDYCPEN